MNERFGVLRSLLADPERTPDWYDRVSMVLWQGHEQDAAHYVAEWVPYASSFDCWDGNLMELEDLEDFETWSAMAPFGRYMLTLQHEFGEVAELREFLEHPRASTLRELRIVDAPLPPQVCSVIAEASHMTALRVLCIRNVDIGDEQVADEQVARLADAPHLAALEQLYLTYVGATFEGLQSVFMSPHMRELRVLHYDGNRLGDLDQILGQPWMELPNLRELNLDENGLGGDHVAELVDELGAFRGLKTLSLAFNRLGEMGAGALARCNGLAALESLCLMDSGIDDDCARHLAESEHLTNVKRLSLRGNPIGEEGREAIASSPYLSASAKASAFE